MSSRVPSFLLGGINLTYNFLGSRTARTAAYGIFEIGVKIAPVPLLFIGAAKAATSDQAETSLEDAVKAPAPKQ